MTVTPALRQYAERLLTGTGLDLDRVLAADLTDSPGAAASALRDGFTAASHRPEDERTEP